MLTAINLTKDLREEIWLQLNQAWDVIVIGGGITGAGIFREAVRVGLKTLLVEQQDFAWGTSSRSSKLVHGGLRYLKQGNVSRLMILSLFLNLLPRLKMMPSFSRPFWKALPR